MPKKLHRKLSKEAIKKFGSATSEKAKRYIYGTMKKVGWKPKSKKK